MLVDSHAHIQLDTFDADREEVLARAWTAGVHKILVVGFNLETSRNAVVLAEEHSGVYATVGVHPHDANDLDIDTLQTFRELASHAKVLALGEMGLDYYRDLSLRSVQKTAFEKQLDLAEELDLPIVVHNRDAHDEIVPILRARGGRIRGVMHCFSGDVETMRQILNLGLYIGIGGPVTYRKSYDLQDVVRKVEADRFLVETDSPWLAPQLLRGERNEPAYVCATAEKVASLRQTSLEEVAELTTQNFNRLFRENFEVRKKGEKNRAPRC